MAGFDNRDVARSAARKGNATLMAKRRARIAAEREAEREDFEADMSQRGIGWRWGREPRFHFRARRA